MRAVVRVPTLFRSVSRARDQHLYGRIENTGDSDRSEARDSR